MSLICEMGDIAVSVWSPRSLLLCFLLTLFPLCHGYCPLATMDYTRCENFYINFESALVANQRNLYRIHEEFFPSSRSSPINGDVTYIIPCIDRSTNTNSSSFNSSVFIYTEWSGSILLAYLSPGIVNSLQLELLDMVLSYTTRASLMELALLEFNPEPHYSEYQSWHLSLIVSLSSASPLESCDQRTAEEVLPVLRDMTSWMKAYARAQGSRASWHPLDILQNKGYSYPKSGNGQDTLLNQIPYLLVTIDILSLALVGVIMLKVAPSLYTTAAQRMRRGNKWYSYVWATVTVATLINLVTLVFELYALRVENVKSYTQSPCPECSQNVVGYREKFERESKIAAGIQLYKSLTVFLAFAFDFLLALLLPKDSTVPIPRPFLYLSYGICCAFSYSHTKRSKVLQTFALWSILGFVHIVTMSVLAVVVWVVVLPAETVSIVALLITLTYCTITFLALILRNIRRICFKTLTLRGLCIFILPILTLSILMAMIVVTAIVYLRLITTRIETSSVGGFLATFLPSVVLTVLGWIVTKGNPIKYALNRKWQDGDSEDSVIQGEEEAEEEEKEGQSSFGPASESNHTPVTIEMESPFQPAKDSLKEPLLTT